MRGATNHRIEDLEHISISIHAPHAGRDNANIDAKFAALEFQSTRPMRGATADYVDELELLAISIHAPHAGRDSG